MRPGRFSNDVIDRLTPYRAKASRLDALAAGDQQRSVLVDRARYLSERDRLLVQMSLSGRFRLTELAVLFDRNPGVLSRRVRRLVAQLHDPVIAGLADPGCTLSAEDRQLGLDHLLRRIPLRVLAERNGQSTHYVRQRLGYVRGFFTGRRHGAHLARRAMELAQAH